MSKYEKYYDEVLELNSKGARNKEIAQKVGIDSRRVSDILKKHGVKANERKFNDQPTKKQEKIFQSLFLGDGAIYKSKDNVNYRVNLAHSLKQKEYFMMKYNIVKDFIGTECWEESQVHNVNGKTYSCIKFQSLVNPYFTRMRKKWYKNDKKIIPKDIEEILDSELLAYKFFDDGFLNASGYSIAMHDYDNECVERFAEAIKNNFGITVNVVSNHDIIYIPARHREEFDKLVRPHATSDVLYKLGEFRETPNE